MYSWLGFVIAKGYTKEIQQNEETHKREFGGNKAQISKSGNTQDRFNSSGNKYGNTGKVLSMKKAH